VSKVKRHWHRKWRWQRVTKIMARDGSSCSICGKPLARGYRDPNHESYITFDHIVPRSRGGASDLGNLRLAHRSCNTLRGNDPIPPEQEAA
jgi:5-methylcytosine-specific restriction endonuclease McrA